MDEWDDIDEGPRAARRTSSRTRPGLTRDQRFSITLASVAVVMLVLGVILGVMVGRATAPVSGQGEESSSGQTFPSVTDTQPATPPESLETSQTSETSSAAEAEPPETPRQLAPANHARIDASRVNLRWSKVTDSVGGEVTYSFRIQTNTGGGWGNEQTIADLTSRSYSVRVLSSTRRWQVWAVDSASRESARSGWRTYRHTAPKPTPTPKPTSKPDTGTP